jgi:hypothetical protein
LIALEIPYNILDVKYDPISHDEATMHPILESELMIVLIDLLRSSVDMP